MADHGFDLKELERKLGSHSVFAPSASPMWLYCAGSLIPNLLAEDNAGEDAAYGTVAHGVAEVWLNSGIRPDYLVGTVEEVDEGHEVFKIEITVAMLDYVEEYVDWCVWLPGQHHVEKRVDFSRLTPIPRQGGTADHIACEPGVMTITDLKMGKGVQVFAKGNTQARLYALGAFYRWDAEYHFKRIVIRIAQPRLNHFDVWEVSREELLKFAEFVRERAALAWQPNAPRTPGQKQCMWCKVKSDCAAFAVMTAELSEGVFENLDAVVQDDKIIALKNLLDDPFDDFSIKPAPVATLSLEQMEMLLPWRKTVENWWKALEDEIEKRLQAGAVGKRNKLVEGRSNRDWRGSDDAVLDNIELMFELPREKLISSKLISPAQFEELVVKEGLLKRKQLPDYMKPLVTKPRGKPVMAPMHDKRPALTITTDDVFDDLDGGEL
jgi:hypothetical protein